MDKSDGKEFGEELNSLLSFYSNEKVILSGPDKRKWWNALVRFDIADVAKAFDLYTASGRFKPKPVDIIDILTKSDGRPEPEEAWALSIRAQDEGETITWTQEMAEAWSMCLPIMQNGDDVGARMAFKQHYERLVGDCRSKGIKVAWSLSVGNDKSRRNDAIKQAEARGLISRDKASMFLIEDMTDEGKEILGLLGYSEESVQEASNQDRKEHIEKLRADIAQKGKEAEEKRAKEREESKRKEEARRAELLEQEKELIEKAKKQYSV